MLDRSKVTFACVLRSGGDFSSKHVYALRDMIAKHVSTSFLFGCFSDVDLPGVWRIPLKAKYPGKWSMVEVFRTVGPTIVFGLDTVIVGDLSELVHLAMNCPPKRVWLIDSFHRKRKLANGIMIWNGDWSKVFTEYNYKEARKRSRLEMISTILNLKKLGAEFRTINEKVPGIYSYKKHCRDVLPKDAKIVLFHGKPRPHQVQSGWMRKKYPWEGAVG